MKRIFFGLALLLSTTAFAKHPPLDERIVEQFEKTFGNLLQGKIQSGQVLNPLNVKLICYEEA